VLKVSLVVQLKHTRASSKGPASLIPLARRVRQAPVRIPELLGLRAGVPPGVTRGVSGMRTKNLPRTIPLFLRSTKVNLVGSSISITNPPIAVAIVADLREIAVVGQGVLLPAARSGPVATALVALREVALVGQGVLLSARRPGPVALPAARSGPVATALVDLREVALVGQGVLLSARRPGPVAALAVGAPPVVVSTASQNTTTARATAEPRVAIRSRVVITEDLLAMGRTAGPVLNRGIISRGVMIELKEFLADAPAHESLSRTASRTAPVPANLIQTVPILKGSLENLLLVVLALQYILENLLLNVIVLQRVQEILRALTLTIKAWFPENPLMVILPQEPPPRIVIIEVRNAGGRPTSLAIPAQEPPPRIVVMGVRDVGG